MNVTLNLVKYLLDSFSASDSHRRVQGLLLIFVLIPHSEMIPWKPTEIPNNKLKIFSSVSHNEKEQSVSFWVKFWQHSLYYRKTAKWCLQLQDYSLNESLQKLCVFSLIVEMMLDFVHFCVWQLVRVTTTPTTLQPAGIAPPNCWWETLSTAPRWTCGQSVACLLSSSRGRLCGPGSRTWTSCTWS